MTTGTALFDFALFAYPLYQTNRLNIDPDTAADGEMAHWLRFWTVAAGLSLVEDFGIDTLPGYYFMKSWCDAGHVL